MSESSLHKALDQEPEHEMALPVASKRYATSQRRATKLPARDRGHWDLGPRDLTSRSGAQVPQPGPASPGLTRSATVRLRGSLPESEMCLSESESEIDERSTRGKGGSDQQWSSYSYLDP
jgi:hypothetical protein